MLVKVHKVQYNAEELRIETPILLNIDSVETIMPMIPYKGRYEGCSVVTFPTLDSVEREIYIAESVDHIAAHLPSIVRV